MPGAGGVAAPQGQSLNQRRPAMRRLRQIFPAPLVALITGLIVAAIGVILLVGGIWLTALGGSAYYLIAGGAMLAAGLLLMRGRILGGWISVVLLFRSEARRVGTEDVSTVRYLWSA